MTFEEFRETALLTIGDLEFQRRLLLLRVQQLEEENEGLRGQRTSDQSEGETSE